MTTPDAKYRSLQWALSEIARLEHLVARLETHIARVEQMAVCPECGGSLLSDHDLDCRYWGKPPPAQMTAGD